MSDLHSEPTRRLKFLLARIHQTTRLKPVETLVLAIYPITVFLGQLIHSSSTEIVTNYYTNRHNLLNTLFVKRGWGWTLFILAYLKFQHFKAPNNRSISLFVLRISIGTLWWVLFTQWFFGLPIMDRVFLLTGGVCRYDTLNASSKGLDIIGTIGSVLCRKLKGEWTGGHDPSGHVFLLVHSSVILWFEVLEVGAFKQLTEFKREFQTIHSSDLNNVAKLVKLLSLLSRTSSVLLIMLLALWWWMLLVTSTHFHSFLEKVTGLIAAYLGVVLYLAPRFLQQ